MAITLQDFASMYGNPEPEYFNQDTGVYARNDNYYGMLKNAIQSNYVDQWGRAAPTMDWSAYSVVPGVSANSGIDNKDAVFKGLLDAGAYYDPNLDPYSRLYWLPNEFTPPPTASNPNPTPVPSSAASIPDYIDYNPEVVDEWGLIPYLAPIALGLISGGALGLFGGTGGLLGAGEAAAGGLLDTAASPFFNTAWAANNAAALNLGGMASAIPELNLLGAGASSLASSIPSLANALSAYGVTPIPSQAVYDAANLVGTSSTPWDTAKDLFQNNATDIGKTAYQMFGETPQGQATPNYSMPNLSSSAGGQQPSSNTTQSQQGSQAMPQQLSVPQFTQMESPQQGSSYQMPVYGQQQGQSGFNEPSIFQLSQSTWNPSMANALRTYNNG